MRTSSGDGRLEIVFVEPWDLVTVVGDRPYTAFVRQLIESDELQLSLRIDDAPVYRGRSCADVLVTGRHEHDTRGLRAAQDPCERYEAGDVAAHGSSDRVAIHGVCSGTRSARPDVIVEVARRNDRWVVVNLHYPQGQDLLTTLRLLRDGR